MHTLDFITRKEAEELTYPLYLVEKEVEETRKSAKFLLLEALKNEEDITYRLPEVEKFAAAVARRRELINAFMETMFDQGYTPEQYSALINFARARAHGKGGYTFKDEI